MRFAVSVILLLGGLICFSGVGYGQVDDMCREFGAMPSMDSPFEHVPYIYGRVTLKGVSPGVKPPRVTVALVSAQHSRNPITVGSSGNYCFKPTGGGGGTLIVDVGGIEVERRSLPAIGSSQQREDFEIVMDGIKPAGGPAVVSVKFSHPRNEKTVDLYKKAGEAQNGKDVGRTIGYLNEIVAVDPADFIAWGLLGSLHFERSAFAEAETAFRKAIALKPDYTPVWINVGKMRAEQKQLEAAIEIFKHASELEPKNAEIFKFLGETYVRAKLGTLGVAALNEAIKLDPAGMAECHLMIAKLYDMAGAKPMAAREYKLFLEKTPGHSDRKKLEKYIKDNPE